MKVKIMNTIIDIIDAEDKSNPLKDKEISELLKKKGIDADRRKVARFRQELGYLSSSKRVRIENKQFSIYGGLVPSKKDYKAPKRDKEYWFFYILIAQKNDDKAIIYGITKRPLSRKIEYNSKLKNEWKIVGSGTNHEFGVAGMGDKMKCLEVENWAKKRFKKYLDREDLIEGFTENTKYSEEVLNKIRWKVYEII